MRRVLIPLLALICSHAFARPLTPEEKRRDFDQLVSQLLAGYGPLDYKREVLGIDLASVGARYRETAQQTATNLDFYYLLNRFIAEFRDSHFAGRLPTDARASLGFTVDLVEGRVLIDAVDRDVLSDTAFPFKRGDELVAIGGRAVADVMAELASYIGAGYSETARRYSAMLLTQRSAARVPLPTGSVEVRIVSDTGAASVRTVDWRQSGTKPEVEAIFDIPEVVRETRRPWSPQDFQLSIADTVEELFFARGELSYLCSGKTRITIPSDATTIMDTPFVAYYHPHPSDSRITVGYLRIPHYYPALDGLGEADPDKARFDQYEYAVSVLEAHADVLVIDQDHNCGGSVDYLEKIVSLFATAPFDQLQFRFLATRPQVLEFDGYLSGMSSHTLAYRNLKETRDVIDAAWRSGTTRLAPKIGLFGTAKVAPHSVRYTKPILMLVDEMSGSGGDAFPSIMQGIGRAKLMGRRTMGAGGHVTSGTPLDMSAQLTTITRSLFYRPDGTAVENNGAVPDFDYTPTRADFVGGYLDYQKAYLQRALTLVHPPM